MRKQKNIFLSAAGLINRMDPDLPIPQAFRFYRAAYKTILMANRLHVRRVKHLEKSIADLQKTVDELSGQILRFELALYDIRAVTARKGLL